MVCIGVVVAAILWYAFCTGESASGILSSRVGQDVDVTLAGDPPRVISGKLIDVDDSGILVAMRDYQGMCYAPMRNIISVQTAK
jgi:hypothetical protein